MDTARSEISALQERDAKVLWHPYAPAVGGLPPWPVASASGVYLELADGRRLIDGMSSWWAVIHGYNHPRLNAALQEQLSKMAHVMFGGLTHEPAIRLAERLVALTPPGLERVFFSDSGSVAVEVAIKLALQYQIARGRPEKRRLLTVRGGYHGDTFAAMSVCDPVNGMHHLFRGRLMEQLFVARPEPAFGAEWRGNETAELEAVVARCRHEIAALILEPVVQGAGGMRFYHPAYLKRARELCDEYDLLLIADEIATGFGRSGRLFACEFAGISPDILCLGKALTGGYLSFAATLMTEEIAQTISENEPGALMHGPTFMANPLACAVALASLELLEESPWRERVERIEGLLAVGLEPCRDLPGVRDVRVLGAIGVVETEKLVDVARIQRRVMERGVWLRPFARLCYTMPPFIASAAEIESITAAMRYALS